MNASYEARTDYIFIKIMGQYSHSSAIEIFRKWVEEAQRLKIYKVLCDLTQLIRIDPKEPKSLERFDAGELIALFMPKNISLAILVKNIQIEKGRFGENLMRNRGIRVKVTPNLEEALQWLNLK